MLQLVKIIYFSYWNAKDWKSRNAFFKKSPNPLNLLYWHFSLFECMYVLSSYATIIFKPLQS